MWTPDDLNMIDIDDELKNATEILLAMTDDELKAVKVLAAYKGSSFFPFVDGIVAQRNKDREHGTDGTDS